MEMMGIGHLLNAERARLMMRWREE